VCSFPSSQELIKPTVRLSENPSAAELAARTTSLSVLHTCLDFGLRLLHPIMPFITEELYHRLPGANIIGEGGRNACGSIMVAAYPSPAMSLPFYDVKLDSTMALLNDIAHSARSTRASLQLTKQRLTMYIQCGTEEIYNTVKANAKDIAVMSNAAVAHALRTSVDTHRTPNTRISSSPSSSSVRRFT
jgi:valyl-tRNA synthetase